MARSDGQFGAKSYWVVVADEFMATIYARDKKYSPMQEVLSLQNETAREKGSDLESDRSGRSFDSAGHGRHSMGSGEPGTKVQSYLVFAKEIAERISSAKQHGTFDRLVVIAAPRFLGVLRPALFSAGIDPEREIDKELTGQKPAVIQDLLDAE